MKRRSVEKAYRGIRPDRAAKERMLQNILSSASEIPLTGKDEVTMQKKHKPLLIAAIIALMVLLMGCAIVVLNLQDLKIGDMVIPGREYQNEEGIMVTGPDIEKEVISLQGYANSPGMLAAKEWFEFEESYDPDYKLVTEAEQSGFQAPAEYDAYSAYTQEMVDKVNEIAAKYGLKLAGEFAIVQNWEWELFFEALGLDGLVRQEEPVETEYRSGYFYECGNFSFDFRINLTGENAWPSPVLVSMRYNDKEYLDVIHSTVDSIADCEQWTYRTGDGRELLLVMSDNSGRIYCDREDAFISVSFFWNYELDSGELQPLKKKTVEQVAEVIDFEVKPQKPDMKYVKQTIAESEAKRQEELASRPEETDEQIYRAHIQNRLDNLEHPENVYYLKWDVNGDGTMDLLMGSKEELEIIFTVMDDENSGTRHITFLPLAEDAYAEWEKVWPDMEIWPITTYPME